MSDELAEAKARQRRKMTARTYEGPHQHFPPVPGEQAIGHRQPATTFCRMAWPEPIDLKWPSCPECSDRYQREPALLEGAREAHQERQQDLRTT